MNYSADQAASILQAVEAALHEDSDAAAKLRKIWLTLLVTRSHALTNGLRQLLEDRVYSGPFKGMTLTEEAMFSGGCRAPVLLGCYETELHRTFEEIIAGAYTRILNIGCSVGFYAVGLARRMPQATVHAFDIDAEARRKCSALAELNNVSDRVIMAGAFHGDDFEKYAAEKTLVLMDIEGGELDVLNPQRFPALRNMDVVVELHDLMNPALSKIVSSRFAPTHDIEIIKNQNALPDVSALLPQDYFLDPFDHMLMAWESRGGPTPWGIFKLRGR